MGWGPDIMEAQKRVNSGDITRTNRVNINTIGGKLTYVFESVHHGFFEGQFRCLAKTRNRDPIGAVFDVRETRGKGIHHRSSHVLHVCAQQSLTNKRRKAAVRRQRRSLRELLAPWKEKLWLSSFFS